MAKLTGPLFSFTALGTIAKAITYSRWKGVGYARQRVIPANPNSLDQQETRNTFKMLSGMWKVMQALAQAPWDANATGRPYTGRNRFMGDNLEVLRGDATMDAFLGSPGALAGPATPAIAAVYGAPNITVTMTAPTLPAGWTITEAQAIAFPDQDPALIFAGPLFEASDATVAYAPVLDITDGPAGDYQVAGWFKYLRDDGRVAYGLSAADQITK